MIAYSMPRHFVITDKVKPMLNVIIIGKPVMLFDAWVKIQISITPPEC